MILVSSSDLLSHTHHSHSTQPQQQACCGSRGGWTRVISHVTLEIHYSLHRAYLNICQNVYAVLESPYQSWLIFVFQKLIVCLAPIHVRNVARNWRHCFVHIVEIVFHSAVHAFSA